MKITLFTICVLCLFVTSLAAQPFIIDDIPLRWKDFEVKDGFRSHPYSAKIYTYLRYEYKFEGVDAKTQTRPLVIETELTVQEQSWVKKEFISVATAEQKQALLNHEKGHLIVALICFKELQQNFSGFHFTKRFKVELDSLHKLAMAKSDSLNTLYDNETNHSVIVEKQSEWEKKLLAEVDRLYGEEKKLRTQFEIKTAATN